jgi:Co/Zn/Cd efflux system component
MKDCCEFRADVPGRQRRVLQLVLLVNVGLFAIELVMGLIARSTALLADSADMLGDAIVYGFSLYVLARGPVWQGRAALLKGLVMALFGLGILAEVGLKLTRGLVPDADVMGGIGLLALAGNAACLALLWKHRVDDINMRSAWICSRNDIAANAGVLVAAAAVALTGSGWPDAAIGLAVAALFGSSAIAVMRDALRGLQLAHRP